MALDFGNPCRNDDSGYYVFIKYDKVDLRIVHEVT